jgi:hypothetical protein
MMQISNRQSVHYCVRTYVKHDIMQNLSIRLYMFCTYICRRRQHALYNIQLLHIALHLHKHIVP